MWEEVAEDGPWNILTSNVQQTDKPNLKSPNEPRWNSVQFYRFCGLLFSTVWLAWCSTYTVMRLTNGVIPIWLFFESAPFIEKQPCAMKLAWKGRIFIQNIYWIIIWSVLLYPHLQSYFNYANILIPKIHRIPKLFNFLEQLTKTYQNRDGEIGFLFTS